MHWYRTLGVVVLVLTFLSACGGDGAAPTATAPPAAQVTPTALPLTATVTAIATQTPIPSPSPTVAAVTPTAVPTATPRPIPSPTPAPTATPTATPLPGVTLDPNLRGQIIFDGLVVDEQGHLRYSVINPDGTDLRWLTDGPDDFEGRLALSPDGTRAAFIRGSGGVYVVDIATGAETFIVPGRASVAWSPDGMRLLLRWQAGSAGPGCCGGDRTWEDPPVLAMVAADGTNLWVLEASTLSAEYGLIVPMDASWSPDGTRVAYWRNYTMRIGQEEWLDGGVASWSSLIVVNADGTDLREIDVPVTRAADWLAWTPDGQVLILKTYWGLDSQTGLYRLDLDGETMTRLTPSDLFINYAMLTPDGQSLAFNAGYPDSSGSMSTPTAIFAMRLDGSALTQLTSFDDDLTIRSWAPDGSHMLVGTWDEQADMSVTLIMRTDGNEPRRLTDAFVTFTTWSPDGRHLIAVVSVPDTSWTELRVFNVETGASWPLAHVFIAEAGGGRVWWLPEQP